MMNVFLYYLTWAICMGATFPNLQLQLDTMTKYCQLNQIMRGLEIQEEGI